jgi:transcriptional regulator with XRE-family HTH domain
MTAVSEFLTVLPSYVTECGSAAEVARRSGVSATMVREWVRGTRVPSARSVAKVQEAMRPGAEDERAMKALLHSSPLPDPVEFTAVPGPDDARRIRELLEGLINGAPAQPPGEFWDHAAAVAAQTLTGDFTMPADATESFEAYVRVLIEQRDKVFRKGQKNGVGGASNTYKVKIAECEAQLGLAERRIAAAQAEHKILKEALERVRRDDWLNYAISLRDQLIKALPLS